MEEQYKKKEVRRIFDSISIRYDFLNHFLSAGIDFYWRNKAIKLSNMDNNSILLDIACGTGDFAIEAKKFGVNNIFGADFSFNMLKLFNKKADWITGSVVQCAAERLPYKDDTFTNITVAFGVRNFYNLEEGFKSFYHILKLHGKLTILEFSLPTNKYIRTIYLFYFTRILPLIGGFISKDKEAYRYLPESVEEFDKRIDLTKLLYDCGFSVVTQHPISFGLVQIVIAEK